MAKIFDALAVISGILVLIFIMALDSPSTAPLYICLVCAIYLLVYARAKGVDVDDLD